MEQNINIYDRYIARVIETISLRARGRGCIILQITENNVKECFMKQILDSFLGFYNFQVKYYKKNKFLKCSIPLKKQVFTLKFKPVYEYYIIENIELNNILLDAGWDLGFETDEIFDLVENIYKEYYNRKDQ